MVNGRRGGIGYLGIGQRGLSIFQGELTVGRTERSFAASTEPMSEQPIENEAQQETPEEVASETAAEEAKPPAKKAARKKRAKKKTAKVRDDLPTCYQCGQPIETALYRHENSGKVFHGRGTHSCWQDYRNGVDQFRG